MPRARRNPSAIPEKRLFELRDRIYGAVNDGLRQLVEQQTVAKIFTPVPPETVGTVAQEMELVRLVAGDWRRHETKNERLGITFSMSAYLAFTYCAERALLAAGETKAAAVFAFIRSTKSAKKTVGGFPAKGGLSRILTWYRDHGPLGTNDAEKEIVIATSRIIELRTPLDTLLFSRSELFPVERWADGWSKVDDQSRTIRPYNYAWRWEGKEIKGRDVLDGLLGAGTWLNAFRVKGVNLDGIDLSGCLIEKSSIEDCSMRGALLRKGKYLFEFKNTDLREIDGTEGSFPKFVQCDLSNAVFVNANLWKCDFGHSDPKNANFDGADLSVSDMRSCNFSGSSFVNAKLSRAKMVYADMSNTNLKNANLSGAEIYSTNFEGANLSGASFLHAFRGWDDPPIPGWERQTGNGMIKGRS